MRRKILVVAAVASAAALALWSSPAGAQIDVHVVWPADTVRVKFLDLGREGLRLGDRLMGRGPLLDSTETSKVGAGHLDCVAASRITDDPSGPGGVYRCSYCLTWPTGTSYSRASIPTDRVNTRWRCSEAQERTRRQPAARRSSIQHREPSS